MCRGGVTAETDSCVGFLNRELQESKKVFGDTSAPESAGLPHEMPAGLLGLEIPPEVKSALQVTPLFLMMLLFGAVVLAYGNPPHSSF